MKVDEVAEELIRERLEGRKRARAKAKDKLEVEKRESKLAGASSGASLEVMLNRLIEAVKMIRVTEGLPATRDGWIAMLAEPADEQRLRFARVRAGIARNHQHPMIRNAPRFAAAAYRFTCDALKPWVRCGDGGAGPCPLCWRGANTGMHLLTACKSPAARAVNPHSLPPNPH